MTALLQMFWLILRDQRPALLRGAALSLTVLLAGVALLGLSGWFITAAAAAGLTATGAMFDVFRPSAMVRFLALGRTAARYGERVLTHDATLRALAGIRVRLLAALVHAPHEKLAELRGAQTLNRVMADVDALDGVSLRLVLPITAGIAALALSGIFLWLLVHPLVALWVTGGIAAGAAAVLLWAARRAQAPSRRAEMAAQAFRSRLIDMIRGRADLAVYGRLTHQHDAILEADRRRDSDRATLDQIERRAGLALSVLGTMIAAGALAIGMMLSQEGRIAAPMAAVGFFVSLALMEAVAPLRRAMADLGRMMLAARRVRANLSLPIPPAGQTLSGLAGAEGLVLKNISFQRPGSQSPILSSVSLSLSHGETLAVTGASGSGKSTLLLLAAGLLTPQQGCVLLQGQPLADWAEPAMRARLVLVPQRTSLMAGSIRSALQLAAPDAPDTALWKVLAAVCLTEVVMEKGGLDAMLGPGGNGLSGGEARRIALARALLRHPEVLLLDEPTEGLDDAKARAVLEGIRNFLPEAAILMASHRSAETDWAMRRLTLTKSHISNVEYVDSDQSQ